MKHLLTLLTAILTLPSLGTANITLPAIFGDHMVLQQESTVPIWGWGKPGETVRITCGWEPDTVYEHKIGSQAKWSINVNTPAAGGPYSMVVQGYNRIHLTDVLIGEVWLCSGQSNMEWTARMGIDNADAAVAEADHPEIRFFAVEHTTADCPQNHLIGKWVKCSPETMIDFSAVAYYFGRTLQDSLGAPVGLIASAWGGTTAEPWMPLDTFLHDDFLRTAAERLDHVRWGPAQTGRIFHAMIHPLIPFKLAGVIWYQGESNTGNPSAYDETFAALIDCWRMAWGDPFPFYYVQIAPYKYGWTRQGALLRDAQRQLLKMPGTGMVVVSDIGNIEDIHPRNKEDVGKRLALWALHHDYRRDDMVCSGPLYRSYQVQNRAIRIDFDYADGGLLCKGEELTHFEIAGTDRQFYPARATIDGHSVVVKSVHVTEPVAVRFAMYNTDEPNLFNAAGLPASCFRTDEWEVEIEELRN